MINKESLELIKSFEGLELQAYADPVGVLTIGYGHTNAAGPPKVYKGQRITAKEAEEILLNDLKSYEASVQKAVKVPLNENQYGALVSFTYNLGAGNLQKSTLLRKLNSGDYKGAADEFLKWDKAGGKTLRGLTRRRQAERALFLKDAVKAPQKPVDEPKAPEAPVVPEKPQGSWTRLLEALLKVLKVFLK